MFVDVVSLGYWIIEGLDHKDVVLSCKVLLYLQCIDGMLLQCAR